MKKVTIQIPEEAISYARVLVDELRETGAAVDTANWGQMAKVDENAGELNEALADLFIAVLVDNGVIAPLVYAQDNS
jgi:hypothetical protein